MTRWCVQDSSNERCVLTFAWSSQGLGKVLDARQVRCSTIADCPFSHTQTLQTIALLAHLRAKGLRNFNMIVVPKAVLTNWESEFKKSAGAFLPFSQAVRLTLLPSTGLLLPFQSCCTTATRRSARSSAKRDWVSSIRNRHHSADCSDRSFRGARRSTETKSRDFVCRRFLPRFPPMTSPFSSPPVSLVAFCQFLPR